MFLPVFCRHALLHHGKFNIAFANFRFQFAHPARKFLSHSIFGERAHARAVPKHVTRPSPVGAGVSRGRTRRLRSQMARRRSRVWSRPLRRADFFSHALYSAGAAFFSPLGAVDLLDTNVPHSSTCFFDSAPRGECPRTCFWIFVAALFSYVVCLPLGTNVTSFIPCSFRLGPHGFLDPRIFSSAATLFLFLFVLCLFTIPHISRTDSYFNPLRTLYVSLPPVVRWRSSC